MRFRQVFVQSHKALASKTMNKNFVLKILAYVSVPFVKKNKKVGADKRVHYVIEELSRGQFRQLCAARVIEFNTEVLERLGLEVVLDFSRPSPGLRCITQRVNLVVSLKFTSYRVPRTACLVSRFRGSWDL